MKSFHINSGFLFKGTLIRNSAVNIAENENEFYIELAVPGLKKEEANIQSREIGIS